MVQRVYEQCKKSRLDRVMVATDDSRIYSAVQDFGGEAIMTDPDLPSGTDRCREALKQSDSDAELVVNIQGDEPFIHPDRINEVLDLLEVENTEIATLVSPAISGEELMNPNRVKVVLDSQGCALYFSRQAIPYINNVPPEEWNGVHRFFIHLGIYGFTRDALLKTGSFEPGRLEMAESLEQLRWLEGGMRIAAAVTTERPESVDTPGDLEAIEKRHFL